MGRRGGIGLWAAAASSSARAALGVLAVLALLGVLGVAAATAGAGPGAMAPRLRPVVLPRDHGAHPAFGIEWWYTTGTFTGARRRPYFWFATVWVGGGYRVARVNVVDLRADRTVLARQYLARGLPAAGSTELTVDRMRVGWRPAGARGRWSVQAAVPGAGALALSLTPTQPYLMEGSRGILSEPGGTASAYYSAPRLAVSGTLHRGRRTTRIAGLGWFDHQWGNFATTPAALHWNWFACQLASGADLMLYQFITPAGLPSGVEHATYVSPRGAVSYPRRLHITPLGVPAKPAGATGSYPLRWRLSVPSAHVDLTIASRGRDGFIANQLIPSFWEAPAAITRGATGGCTVESTRETGGR